MAGNGINDRIRDRLLAEHPQRRGFGILTKQESSNETRLQVCARIGGRIYLNNGTETMKCTDLAGRIERLRPGADAVDVARLCLLLSNSAENLSDLSDDSRLATAWKEIHSASLKKPVIDFLAHTTYLILESD